ncbi:MAG TPA: hypothetical protein PKD09_16655 [Aggregatilinea sp.]|uniref:hypothetical protein n=1 Tax=Aggregatilinea sp. TaxID=2806333 RepID=UPI002BA3AAB4|nr:hypothetical protein [Aggregatilinea sp.]HML23287.1 hypothetical protein [Aggregatilinea sp.]
MTPDTLSGLPTLDFTGDFWDALDQLVARCPIVIDRPKDSAHPRYPSLIYPVDYGYLDGTTSSDGVEIDVWRGSEGSTRVNAISCSVDGLKRDAEIKLLIGCTPDDQMLILAQMNSGVMRAIIVRRDT